MAGNNTQEQFYGAEIAELSKNIKDLNSQVACIKGVCAERYKVDFYSEINVLKHSFDDICKDIDKLEKEGKERLNSISELNNQIIELSGQMNSVKLRIDELLSSQNKQTESKADLWKQIIIIVLGSLIVSLTLWMTNNIISSFKESVYNNVKYASGYTDTNVTDCNKCIKVGYYFVDRNTTNKPTNETYGILHVFGHRTDIESKSSQWIFQEFTSEYGKKYIRYSINPNSLTPTNWSTWQRVCTTNDITTTINSASTASQVPSAKSVYDNAIKKNGLIWQGTQQLQNSQESSVFNYCKSNFTVGRICGFRLEPKDGSGYFSSASVTIIYCLSSVNYGWILGISDKSGTPMAIMQIVEGGTKKWTRICATSVADVPVTDIKFTSTTNYKPSTQIALKYTVSNGICYVSGGIQCVSLNNAYITVCTLPKPKNGWQYCKTFRIDDSRDESSTVMMLINENGELELSMGTATGEYRFTFSYPVKES